jgi:hypothetical protein
MTIRQAVSILSLAMMWSLSWSCASPSRPEADAKYSTILLGEVVGVRLTDYTSARQQQMRTGAKHPWMSDASPGYEIDVLPIELLKGANGSRIGEVIKLRVPSGCAIPLAELSQYGLFFMDAHNDAMPMYQNDLEYKVRLTALGSQNVSTCMTAIERFSPHPCWKPKAAMIECLTFVKDVAYSTPSSCPAGVQELREQLHQSVLGRFDWQMPPRDPSKVQ